MVFAECRDRTWVADVGFRRSHGGPLATSPAQIPASLLLLAALCYDPPFRSAACGEARPSPPCNLPLARPPVRGSRADNTTLIPRRRRGAFKRLGSHGPRAALDRRVTLIADGRPSLAIDSVPMSPSMALDPSRVRTGGIATRNPASPGSALVLCLHSPSFPRGVDRSQHGSSLEHLGPVRARSSTPSNRLR